MKKVLIFVLLICGMLALTACGNFTCDHCGAEKSGDKHETENKGIKVTVCDDCYTVMFDDQIWALGNTVEFGRYEQDAIYANGKELIEWRIIDKQGERLLLVSEEGLDAVPYVNKENNGKHIIKWLNEDFYGEVFNLEEESMILETDMDDGWAGEKAKVFLLSTREIKKYFDNKEKRILQPTQYAKSKMQYIKDDACLWWTRTGGGAFMTAAYVHFDGYIETFGQYFDSKAVVRPAMWVDIEKFDETIYSSLREQYTIAEKHISENRFDEAKKIFEILSENEYKDSAKMVLYTDYKQAEWYLENGLYDQALQKFRMLYDIMGYSDAKEKKLETTYAYADELFNSRNTVDSDYEDCLKRAAGMFSNLVSYDYLDSLDRETNCWFELAGYYEANERISDACRVYEFLDSYGHKESSKQLNKYLKSYDMAKQALEDGEYGQAKQAFESLKDYSDAERMVMECDYQLAKKLLASGQYSEAKNLFISLGDYSDSIAMISECEYQEKLESDYQKGKELFECGQYKEAYWLLLSIIDYKDVRTYIASNEELKAIDDYRLSFDKYEIVTFGQYEQDGSMDSKEAIEWKVIGVDGNKRLLISVYVLDAMPFNAERKEVTWEKSSIRKWLNEDFYGESFSEAEKAMIELTIVDNISEWWDSVNTKDYVFIPSVSDYGKYYLGGATQPTTYAKNRGVYYYANWEEEFDSCTWWLRSPADSLEAYRCVAHYGTYKYSAMYVDSEAGGVRPAMWINLES